MWGGSESYKASSGRSSHDLTPSFQALLLLIALLPTAPQAGHHCPHISLFSYGIGDTEDLSRRRIRYHTSATVKICMEETPLVAVQTATTC